MDRTHATLAAAAALIGLGAALRSLGGPGREPHDLFWTRKFLAPPRYDLVVAGDSRTYRGVSPEAMAEVLGGARILNFGFSACAFSLDYPAAAERVLDPASARRAVVLGITPHSLTAGAAQDNQYVRLAGADLRELRRALALEPFLRALASFLTLDPPDAFENRKGRFRQTYHADGWVAARQPSRPRLSLPLYEHLFEGNPVDPALVAGLTAAVARWRAAGIRVFAFRPPTSAEVAALEDRLSGFSEERIAFGVEQAGGTWLRIPATEYATYDGSHLQEESAVRFSREIAEQIRALGR